MDRALDSAGCVGVPRLWPGETFVCIASGPSLTEADVNYVRGKARVIVVSDNYKLAPWADVLYSHDRKWWNYHQGVPLFRGLKFGMEVDRWPQVQSVRCGQTLGLSRDPRALNHGQNSGYQAIGLAVHLGASRIVLMGYDMQLGPDKQEHWFGSHPAGVRGNLPLHVFAKHYASLVKPLRELGVEVVNCTRRTALQCFPQMALEDAL